MSTSHSSLQPSLWVTRWASLLPAGSSVLDLACGSGRHVRWLADRGLAVTAVDRDSTALETLRGLSGVEVVLSDLEAQPWPLVGRRFDAVIVTNYLWRPLWLRILDSLGPQGLLIYETFNVDNAAIGKPSNPNFLLRHGELLEMTVGLRTIAYEDGLLAEPDRQVQRIAAARIEENVTDSNKLSAARRLYPL